MSTKKRIKSELRSRKKKKKIIQIECLKYQFNRIKLAEVEVHDVKAVDEVEE